MRDKPNHYTEAWFRDYNISNGTESKFYTCHLEYCKLNKIPPSRWVKQNNHINSECIDMSEDKQETTGELVTRMMDLAQSDINISIAGSVGRSRVSTSEEVFAAHAAVKSGIERSTTEFVNECERISSTLVPFVN